MKKNHLHLIISATLLLFTCKANARENAGISGIAPSHDEYRSVMSGCAPATDEINLDINNVRARILGGGDMWWDLNNNPKYFIPKPPAGSPGPCSLFAGALWIGGIDAGGSLKVASMTYRQTGNDFWPGPLTAEGVTEPATCVFWDKHFKVDKVDVEAYYNWKFIDTGKGASPISATALDAINKWPGTGPDGKPLAPFWDINGNTLYEPELGEVPDFDVTADRHRGCGAKLFGDESIFWVFNDKGNIHTETGGIPIGIEVQAQAFGFKTNDQINDMTFYRYKIINKSSFEVDSTFFGVWEDPDLGGAKDDYIGCDVSLGLGMCYNSDDFDENFSGEVGYGVNPPAVGIDFFEGPFADSNGLDDTKFRGQPVTPSFLNYGDGPIDNERIGMAKFVYYSNNTTVTGNPNGAVNVYQYLTGNWLDATPMTYGGTGHLSGGVNCSYAFPGASDPGGFGTDGVPQAPWEQTANDDGRFLQSAGPFKLMPGAVNTITIGAVWARATSGGARASIPLMKGADVKAQKLFDNCFKTLDGPTAPNLVIEELDKKLILNWSNPLSGSNNAKELYKEDLDLATSDDSLYRFQGYIIYQLKDEFVSSADFYNVDKARIVFQCDKKDGKKQIVNNYFDSNLNALVPKEMVTGSDSGIVHSCLITEDKFATGDNHLINHKTYYYTIIAYGYSPSEEHIGVEVRDYLPFIAGNHTADGISGFVRHGIPHIPSPQEGGTIAGSTWGMGPKLTRIEGQGNGGIALDFTPETVGAILASSSGRVLNPTYENSHGPVKIRVIDPLNVPDGNFRFLMLNDSANFITRHSRWELINLSTKDTVKSDTTIEIPNEQIINEQNTGGTNNGIPKWGLSVTVSLAAGPTTSTSTGPVAPNNAFLEATMSFYDPSSQWLTGLPDEEGVDNRNWIRAGNSVEVPPAYSDYVGIDNGQYYEKVLGGTWAPYRLCASSVPATGSTPIFGEGGPAWSISAGGPNYTQLKNLASVDVVITTDRALWTRCPVVEEQETSSLAVDGVAKLSMRKAPSVDKDGNPDGSGTKGMSWFPGYALNLETGERLNMAFGEDSWLASSNGADMKWNPTSTAMSGSFQPIFGGKHYIYIFGHNGDKTYFGDLNIPDGSFKDIPRYDEGKALYTLFNAVASTSGSTSDAFKKEIYTDAMWVNIPLLAPGHSLLETEVKIRLRVSKPYQFGYSTSNPPVTDISASPINKNLPAYDFNTSDIQTHKNDAATAVEALDLINIVPNPYYAYSAYEVKTLDNWVKITNLPDQCTVSIYTLNGTLIRRLQKDNAISISGERTTLDWDLKNQARIPIASGLYIIHVDVPGVGEKILKWFGVMRPVDVESY